MSDKRIEKLFKSDQRDRRNQKDLEKNDLKRLKALEDILAEQQALDGEDCYRIAMIYHHQRPEYLKMAKEYARRGMLFGSAQARWLYAAVTDRMLLFKNRPQKYGTQWQMRNGKCILWPVDQKTTDRARARYGVESLKAIKAGIRKKNEHIKKRPVG